MSESAQETRTEQPGAHDQFAPGATGGLVPAPGYQEHLSIAEVQELLQQHGYQMSAVLDMCMRQQGRGSGLLRLAATRTRPALRLEQHGTDDARALATTQQGDHCGAE